MDKKGASISINVIIVAIIALLVLVILIVMFMRNMIEFNIGAASCEEKGGVCYSVASECPTGWVEHRWNCPDVGGLQQKCCIQVS